MKTQNKTLASILQGLEQRNKQAEENKQAQANHKVYVQELNKLGVNLVFPVSC